MWAGLPLEHRTPSSAGENPVAREPGLALCLCPWHVGVVSALLPGEPHCSSVPQAEGVRAEPFENHSALEIAEQLTLLDHLVFKKIPYE